MVPALFLSKCTLYMNYIGCNDKLNLVFSIVHQRARYWSSSCIGLTEIGIDKIFEILQTLDCNWNFGLNTLAFMIQKYWFVNQFLPSITWILQQYINNFMVLKSLKSELSAWINLDFVKAMQDLHEQTIKNMILLLCFQSTFENGHEVLHK